MNQKCSKCKKDSIAKDFQFYPYCDKKYEDRIYILLNSNQVARPGDEVWVSSKDTWAPINNARQANDGQLYRRKAPLTYRELTSHDTIKETDEYLDSWNRYHLAVSVGEQCVDKAPYRRMVLASELRSEKEKLSLTDPHLGTGRTTRMLEQVAAALTNGYTVEIVVANRNQISCMQDDLEIIMSENKYDLCNYMDRLNFGFIYNKNCDEGFGLKVPSRGLPQSTKVFVDHYAAESYLATIKRRFDPFIHAYDK